MDCSRGQKSVMRIASIDIGTNTALLLVADVDNDGSIKAVYHEQRIPRLGRNVDKTRHIDESFFPVIASIISEYRERGKQLNASTIVACGTSALRDASNRTELINYVQRESHIRLELLSGSEEALLT